MKNIYITLLTCFFCLIGASFAIGQTITTDVPNTIDNSKKYIIYLHGAIVQQMGAENAVSKYYGRYEYQKILETLAGKGFHVISKVRRGRAKVSKDAKKVAKQVKILEKSGVPQQNIIIVGASLGAYIAIEAAYKLKKENVKYALLGLCSKYAVGYYAKYKNKLRGNFFSIWESVDQKKSCVEIFTPLHEKARFSEIKLNLGTGHGFLYRPYKEWVDPLTKWAGSIATGDIR